MHSQQSSKVPIDKVIIILLLHYWKTFPLFQNSLRFHNSTCILIEFCWIFKNDITFCSISFHCPCVSLLTNFLKYDTCRNIPISYKLTTNYIEFGYYTWSLYTVYVFFKMKEYPTVKIFFFRQEFVHCFIKINEITITI